MQSTIFTRKPGRPGYTGRRIPGLLLSYGRLVLQPLVRHEQAGDTRRKSQTAVSRSHA
jgi:hypothetical protein